MRARSGNWLLLSLVALSALVIAELRFAIGTGPGGRAAVQTKVPAEAAPMPQFTLTERERFSETLTRPLFMPDRQPPAEVPATPVAASRTAPPKANRYALSAIIIVGDQRIALLTDTATGGMNRVREGESIAGWQVEEIHEDSAVLSNGDTREELALRTFGAAAARPRASEPRVGADVSSRAVERDFGALPDRPRRPKRGPRQTLKKPALQRN